MRILAIDPGPTESAYVYYDPESCRITGFAKHPNEAVREALGFACGPVIVEKIESFGMAVGAEVFETVWWAGRFAERAVQRGLPHHRLPRKAVKMHLCGSMRAKDGNIRQALIDKYGGVKAIGKKANPGPLYDISGDVWSALAVAVTWAETVGKDSPSPPL